MTAVPESTFDANRDDLARGRREGRALLSAIHAAARASRLYPPEHKTVERTVTELTALANELGREGELEVRVQGDYLFVNGVRLRLDLGNYASFGRVLEMFQRSGAGSFRVVRPAAPAEWLAFLSVLDQAATEGRADFDALETRLAEAHVVAFDVAAPADEDLIDEADRVAARRTYAHSVALTKDVIHSVRMGRAPSSRKIKRAVQLVVDQVLNEETSLLGLTTLRDYDEYTYTHSVNVCIFAVALGRRLGLGKLELYEIGLAALLHDIGKTRISTTLLQKTSALEEDEWQRVMAHPWLGLLVLFQLRGPNELPFRALLVAYEHHMKCDLSGYPRTIRAREQSVTSRIVAVVDGYDAATTRRSYQTSPIPPSTVLQEMRDNPRRGLDPVIVKAFTALLGAYPVGTLVVLDTYELAIVRAPNPDPEMMSRPRVVIVSDDRGNPQMPPIEADLAVRGADGQFARSILKTADPDQYGIRVSDYIV